MAKKTSNSNGASTPTRGGAFAAKEVRPFERDFNPDYSDVIKDLKTIGGLAGFFLLVLVVLTFFLR